MSFFADWSQGDGAVMMIGGGGRNCERADHGIAVTEANDSQFGTNCAGCETRQDFGGNNNGPNSQAYSLNLWVR